MEYDIETLKNMTEDEVRRKTRFNIIDIRNELEKRAKRLKPEVFIPYIVKFFNDPQRKIIIGPHSYLQAIEANCAYYKDGYDEVASWNKLADIVNLCRKLEDENPYYLWITSKNINIFYQFMYRIQIELQKTEFSHVDLARYWKLFYDNEFTPKLFYEFEKKYSISV